MTGPINTYVSFKRVSRFPYTAKLLARGSNSAGLPWQADIDAGDHSALLLSYISPEGPEVLLRVDFVRLVDSLIAADRAEVDAWEPLREDPSTPGLWGNSILTAHVETVKDLVHISYHRRDRAPIRDWRIGQRLKNQLAGPEWEGIELYPAESRVVDTSNEWHLWCTPRESAFGFDQGERATQAQLDSVHTGPGDGPVQRDDPGADTSSFRPDSIRVEAVRVPSWAPDAID